MKKVVTKYFCDFCNEELTKVRHISIEKVGNFGWVSPPQWEYVVKGNGKTCQFCDEKCFSEFCKGEL